MSSSEAELTLLLKARNLATRELNAVKTSIEGISTKVGALASSFARGAAGLGKDFFRDLTYGLQAGQGLDVAFQSAGAMLGLSLVTALGEKVIAMIAGSAFVAAIGPAIAGAGTAIGAFLAAAIPIGIAALPALLVIALVAAIVFLINNPEIVSKIVSFAGSVIKWVIDGLAGLGGKLVTLFSDAVGLVAKTVQTLFTTAFNVVLTIVTGIVGTIVGVIQGIIDKVAEALRMLGLLNGYEKNVGHLDHNPTPAGGNSKAKPYASGGWAGLHGPELAMIGERGPEFVRKAGTGTGDGGDGAPAVVQVVLDGQVVGRLIDERLFYRRQRSPF